MEYIIFENRLIAFLDILGFSSLLKTTDLGDVHSKYSGFIDQAKTQVFFNTLGDEMGRTNFEYAEFLSDSMVLVSNNIDDIYNVNNFIGAVSFLMEQGFLDALPLRGAISKGDFLLDKGRHIFLSSAFTEAVKFEGLQEWTGCIILKEAEKVCVDSLFGEEYLKTFDNSNQMRNNPVHHYSVPFKKTIEEYFVINFLFFMTEKQIMNGIDKLIEPKKSNVKEYFSFLVDLPLEMQQLSEEFLPAVYSKSMATRSGVRSIFIDSEGNPCKPGVDTFTWIAIGRWK